MKESEISEILDEYAAKGAARFHMPGHKGIMANKGLNALAKYDVTELSCTDDLNAPEGKILELEERIAKIYGAKYSFLLVNGSTSGNIAMILSLGIGKRALVARDCHKSVIAALSLGGHEVKTIEPNAESGIIEVESVLEELDGFDADMMIVTYPTYMGKCCDIEKISEICHERGIKLFTDSAHGAHFPFSADLPRTPYKSDAWVVSAHKTLNSYTQTAILNIGQTNDISKEQMQRYISMVQTTSPSYILMLSIENGINEASNWQKHCERIKGIRKAIEKMDGVRLSTSDGAYDFTRLVIGIEGYSGYEIKEILESRNIYIEMADFLNVVLITSPNDKEEWYDRLIVVLQSIPKRDPIKEEYRIKKTQTGKSKLSVRQAVFGRSESVSRRLSIGRTATEAVGIYPPGTAIIFPGEEITESKIKEIERAQKSGAKVFGTNGELIRVYADE